ncbi:MAG TPA: DUF2306 domain-containing protein [Allosphingosinicella sp.]|jgi:uncharacterized membrane protein|nr:DUF2306 domain-containing protein [Allosphingosinicella sp.]
MATRAAGPARAWRGGNYLIVGAAIFLLTFALMALSFGSATEAQGHAAMSPALVIHLATVLPALPLGAWILVKRKGGAVHRLLGRVWGAMMVTTAISSFWLQENGGLSFIHIFSVITLVSIPIGIFWIRRGDLERHRRAMTSTYIGLVVAGLFAFVPGRLLWTWLLG